MLGTCSNVAAERLLRSCFRFNSNQNLFFIFIVELQDTDSARGAAKGDPMVPIPLAEEVVPKVTSRICGLPFLVQIAPLLSRTELETLTPLLALASVSTPKSIVDRFILKNAVVITND